MGREEGRWEGGIWLGERGKGETQCEGCCYHLQVEGRRQDVSKSASCPLASRKTGDGQMMENPPGPSALLYSILGT